MLLSAGLVGASAYDEYFPLVAKEHGVATGVVPILIGLVAPGQVAGTALAAFALAGDAVAVPLLVALLGVPLAALGLMVRSRMPAPRIGSEG